MPYKISQNLLRFWDSAQSAMLSESLTGDWVKAMDTFQWIIIAIIFPSHRTRSFWHNIVTTHPFSCVRQQAARESGDGEKGTATSWHNWGVQCETTLARSPPFNCPQATVTTEPHGRWLATILYISLRENPLQVSLIEYSFVIFPIIPRQIWCINVI